MSPDVTPTSRRIRARDAGWFLDWSEDVQLVYMDGAVTDASYERYLETVGREIDARRRSDRVSVFYHIPEPAAFSSWRRTRLGTLLREREAILGETTLAYALATPSMMVRAGLKMLFWLAPPPYPNRVVPSVRAGLEFIVSRDRRAALAELEARWAELMNAYRAGPEG